MEPYSSLTKGPAHSLLKRTCGCRALGFQFKSPKPLSLFPDCFPTQNALHPPPLPPPPKKKKSQDLSPKGATPSILFSTTLNPAPPLSS